MSTDHEITGPSPAAKDLNDPYMLGYLAWHKLFNDSGRPVITRIMNVPQLSLDADGVIVEGEPRQIEVRVWDRSWMSSVTDAEFQASCDEIRASAFQA